ncbi:MAG TPA: DUF4244 domain-containing protein [Nocardioides sp.]
MMITRTGTHSAEGARRRTEGGRRRARRLTAGAGDQRGITTAEYAVGTAAGAGLAGLAYQLLTGGLGNQMLTSMFEHVLGLIGIG